MFTLPGVCIQEPIEVDGLAFVSSHDAHIIDLAKKHRRKRFTIRALASKQGAWANIPPKRNRKEAICFSPYLSQTL